MTGARRAGMLVAVALVVATVAPAAAQDPSAPPSASPSPAPSGDAAAGAEGATGVLGATVEGLSLVEQPPAGWPEIPVETAREVMAIDATTGQVLAAVNVNDRVQVASVVKLLTVLTALDVLDPDEMVTVGDEVDIDGSTAALDPGDTWSVRDLVAGALIRSGNDAAEALAVAAGDGDRAAFIQMMNDKAESLGIVGATIADPTGLEDVNLLSGRDLAILGTTALRQPLIAEVANSRSWDLPSTGPVPNRNLLLEMREDATGLKTGTTDLAGASLVGSIRSDDHDLLSVVVGARNDNQRYSETIEVFDWIESSLDRHAVEVGAAIRLPGRWVGEATTVDLWAPEAPTVDTQLAVDGSSVVSEVSVGMGGRLGEYVAAAEVAPPESIGQSVVGKVYEAMRQAHELGTWQS